MGDQNNREGLPQQPDDAARTTPGQQNQQGERQRRDDGDNEGVEGTRVEGLDDGLEGGVDTGAIEPGKTGQR